MTRLILSVLLLASCTASSSQPERSPVPAANGAPHGSGTSLVRAAEPSADVSERPDGRMAGGAPTYAGYRDTNLHDAGVQPAGTAADVTLEGIASWVAPRYGRDYLAMRLPKGTHVTLSGPGGTWEAVVNDYGPAKRTGRIADIAVGRWEAITGLPRSRGLGRVTVAITGSDIRLPDTSTED